MNYVQWKCCSDLTQDQKFILKNVLSINRRYKVQEFNIIKVSDFEDFDTNVIGPTPVSASFKCVFPEVEEGYES